MGRASVEAALSRIASWNGRPLTFMEVCGTHTTAAARFGLKSLLPPDVRLISGPGCPVCVTPVGYVDHAIALAKIPAVTLCTFGDMMRVPGSIAETEAAPLITLSSERAKGADIRVVYSPLDALQIAADEPARQVVFLGVGFETTVPGLAAALIRARESRLTNFSMLTAAKTVPQVLHALAGAPDLSLDGFMCPGHVSAILGVDVYRPYTETYGLACAVAGFEAAEMLTALAALVEQVQTNEPRVENCYPSVAHPEGNPRALEIMYTVFEACDATWRGIGEIPGSGLRIREAFGKFDAARRFEVALSRPQEPSSCRCGEVLRGVLRPEECGMFGTRCTPSAPRGACMVSSEGACAASYNYGIGEES